MHTSNVWLQAIIVPVIDIQNRRMRSNATNMGRYSTGIALLSARFVITHPDSQPIARYMSMVQAAFAPRWDECPAQLFSYRSTETPVVVDFARLESRYTPRRRAVWSCEACSLSFLRDPWQRFPYFMHTLVSRVDGSQKDIKYKVNNHSLRFRVPLKL